MKKITHQILSLSIITNVALSIVSAPIALNDAKTTAKNTSVKIIVLANDLSTTAPLVPSSVTVVSGPDNGTTSVNGIGEVTYTPLTGFVGSDSFIYSVSDEAAESSQATVYITVFDPNAPCPASCPSECCGCFDQVNKCLCTEASLANFTQLAGSWNIEADHVKTFATNPSSFLQYNTPVSQSFEILEVDIKFSPANEQPTNQSSCEGGLVSNWDGSVGAGSSVAFFNYATDGSGNITGTPKFVVETFFGGLHTEANLPLFAYQTWYHLTLIKVFQKTAVFIDDMFILCSTDSGSVPGNFIGIWGFQSTVCFKNFKSCSYSSTPSGFICI